MHTQIVHKERDFFFPSLQFLNKNTRLHSDWTNLDHLIMPETTAVARTKLCPD